jgi:hypothetical protein
VNSIIILGIGIIRRDILDQGGEGEYTGMGLLFGLCHDCHSLVGVYYEGVETDNTCGVNV